MRKLSDWRKLSTLAVDQHSSAYPLICVVPMLATGLVKHDIKSKSTANKSMNIVCSVRCSVLQLDFSSTVL